MRMRLWFYTQNLRPLTEEDVAEDRVIKADDEDVAVKEDVLSIEVAEIVAAEIVVRI